ncbi:hypothetical protein OC835_007286 [Tilletia horrida]|nr:hypothetical protein OC835_007286 [Tilletia horrida]
MTKWMRLSNRIEQDFAQVDSARAYGPELLLDALVSEVHTRADDPGKARFNAAIIKHAVSLFDQEVQSMCSSTASSQALRVSSASVDQSSELHQSLAPLGEVYRLKLPGLWRLFSTLLRVSSVGEDASQAKDVDEDGTDAVQVDQDGEGLLLRRVLPAISSIIFARNRLVNRFQMVIGVFLAVTDTPDLVKGFLHRAGLAVSQPTARSVLESLSDASTNRARQLMKDKRRMKVFLFDNINVYMRRSQIRLMDYNTAVALTMRTLFTLPSSCSPTSITCNHIELLQKADRRAMDTRDVMPDDAFLERAATIHIAEALIDMAKLGSRERGAIIRRLDEMRREHADDVLGPEQTAFVQMKLMREDEGTLEGTQTVLTETVKELGLEFEKEGVQPLLVSGDLLSVRNTLAVQDAGRHEHRHTLHRLDYLWPVSGPWHLLQSWIYLVFKTHFSSSSVGADASLDRARDVLRRGRNALREDKPLFNEAWDFCQIVWKGRLGAILA